MPIPDDNLLGSFLKDRRAKLDPAALGLPLLRRRTPGLRREEVALRAKVSATWYTWLEQGRGGAPSAEVLERLVQALALTQAEREHLFLLALGRPPDVRYQFATGVTPRLQRVLDALEHSPAYVKTATWDVIAWNAAATVVLTDYAALEPSQRNILRLIFCNAHVRAKQTDWPSVARFVVAAFRADTARAGATHDMAELVEDLSRQSPEFAAMWHERDVRSAFGDAPKQLHHPTAGLIAMDYSSFAVEGEAELSLVVYTPVTEQDADKVKRLLAARASLSSTNDVAAINANESAPQHR